MIDVLAAQTPLFSVPSPSDVAAQVQRIPCEDHCPPLLVEVVRFCEDVSAWMRRDPRNVVAAHCKASRDFFPYES